MITALREQPRYPRIAKAFCRLSSRSHLPDRSLLDKLAYSLGLGLCMLALNGCLSRSLSSIQVLPAAGSSTVVAGQTLQFQAVATYTESGHATTTANVTSQVTWVSATPAVATINSAGLATGVSAGTANITASLQGSFGTVVGTSNVGVTAASTAPVLTSLQVLPTAGSSTAAAGQTVQFQAVATYTASGGATTTADVTSQAKWVSSTAAIATINAAGLATAVSAGTSNISATFANSSVTVVGSSNIIVTVASSTPVLTSLQVLPAAGSATVFAGQTVQFQAIATYTLSGGGTTTAIVTSQATWVSSTAAVATINSAGLATTVSLGTSNISASLTGSYGTAVGASNVTVTGTATAELISLQILPASGTSTVIAGQTVQFQAVATYTEPGGTTATADVTSQATWASSAAAAATINAAGLATGISAGTSYIFASLTDSAETAVGTSSMIVTAPGPPRILTSLAVIPGIQAVNLMDETAQFIAIGTYNAAPLTQDLTDQVAWQSSDVAVANINPAGLATGNGSGATTITALAKATDSSIIPATAELTNSYSPGTVLLPTLTIYEVGNGTGTVTGIPSTGPSAGVVVINCGPGLPATGCVASFSPGTVVTLAASPAGGSLFDGWSATCAPDSTASCTVTMNNNDTVGVIFDLTSP